MGRESMLHNINRTLRVTLGDGRELTGRLLVYDRHMNVVLGDAIETRPETKKMRDAGISPQRALGLVLLRGEHVIAVTVLGSDSNGNSGGNNDSGRHHHHHHRGGGGGSGGDESRGTDANGGEEEGAQAANFEKAPRARTAGKKRTR